MTTGRRAWGFEFRCSSDDEDLSATLDWCFGDLPPANADTTPAASRGELRATHSVAAAEEGDIARCDVWLVGADGAAQDCGQGWPQAEVVALVAAVVNGQARRTAEERTVLHAAVFGGPAGAVILCGDTGVGKSTLSAAAALRGWRHLSDDLALIDVARRTVTPYARPIMLRAGSQAVLGAAVASQPAAPPGYDRYVGADRFLPASALGAEVVAIAHPIVAVGVLQRGTAASLQPLRRAALLHALTLHSANLPDRGARGFAELAQLAETVEGFTVTVGDVWQTLDLLAPMVGQAAA